MQRIFRSTFLLTLMMISFTQRKNVRVKFQNQLDPSIAASATVVWLSLIIIAGGWHFLLCLYGTVAIGFILAGQVKELRILHILTNYYAIENSFRSLAPRVLQWILSTYNTQILLMVFLALISLLLAGFFGYHLNLCLTNTTANEKIKWREYMSLEKKISEAKESATVLKAGMTNVELEGPAER